MNKRYLISLPERIVRSSVSGITGISTFISTVFFPKALKNSATYRVTYGMLQQFLVEKIAGVDVEQKDFVLKENYVARKTLGSILEGIGLVSIRFSPVWILAILSDLSGGSKEYFQRILSDLRKNGLIDASKEYNSVFDVLEQIQATTKVGVNTFDMPPLSKADFTEFKEEIVQVYQQNTATTKKMMQELEGVYKQMNQVSRDKKLNISQLNGAMTMELMKSGAKKGIDITKVTSVSSLKMLHELFIDSYKETLNDISKQGKRSYLIKHMTPFVRQIQKQYDPETITSTDKIIRYFRH